MSSRRCRRTGRTCCGDDYKGAVALSGDPRSSAQAAQASMPPASRAGADSDGAAVGKAGLGVLRRPQRRRQFRARSRHRRLADRRQDADRHSLGLCRPRRPRQRRRTEDRGDRSEERRRRPTLRAGDQRPCAAPERRKAVDGISLFGRRPARLAEGQTATRSASTIWSSRTRSRRRWPRRCHRPTPIPMSCSLRSKIRAPPMRRSPKDGRRRSAPG